MDAIFYYVLGAIIAPSLLLVESAFGQSALDDLSSYAKEINVDHSPLAINDNFLSLKRREAYPRLVADLHADPKGVATAHMGQGSTAASRMILISAAADSLSEAEYLAFATAAIDVAALGDAQWQEFEYLIWPTVVHARFRVFDKNRHLPEVKVLLTKVKRIFADNPYLVRKVDEMIQATSPAPSLSSGPALDSLDNDIVTDEELATYKQKAAQKSAVDVERRGGIAILSGRNGAWILSITAMLSLTIAGWFVWRISGRRKK